MRTGIHLVARAALACAAALLIALTSRAAVAAGSLYIATGGEALPLERTDFDVDVAGSVVSATVSQRFTNTKREPIEVVYVFPLPERAAVDALEMKIGARTVRASIARRDEAQRAYREAIQQGRRAALLEQERPNVFTFHVGNVDPGATIDVKLHYFEVARFDRGTYAIALPTTVGPRYIPGSPLGDAASGTGTHPDTDKVPDASRISPGYGVGTGARLEVRAHVDAGAAIESIDAPDHTVDVARPSATIADVRLKGGAPNRDFLLAWRLKVDAVEPSVFAHRPKADAPGYVTLRLEPRHDAPEAEIAPRELFFLLDTSGSMQGAPLAAAVAAVERAVDAMRPGDTFQIVDFADKASTFAASPLPSTDANKRRAREYLAHLRASGGTNQLAGIHAALSARGDESRVRYVVFMTDGYIGNEADVLALTRREIGRARIFSFGVGSNVNRYLLDEVAVAGRGFAEYLRPNEDPKALIERFYARIGKPYLTDVAIDWGDLAVADARPVKLPDLSAFEPLLVHARYERPGAGDVTIQGRLAGRPFARRVHVVLPSLEPKNEALSRLWARDTIAELERRPRGQVDAEAITAVALAHDLVSAYTSFVAIDSATPVGSSAPALVKQPSEAPADVDLGAAGGMVTYASSPAPAPVAEETLALESVAVRRGGGCAGCAVSRADDARAPMLAGLAFVALAIAIRRRRTR